MLPPFVSKQNIYKTREASVCLNLPLPPQVEESQLRRFPRDRERLTAQLSFDIVEFHVRHERRLELTCLSTIPGSLDPEQSDGHRVSAAQLLCRRLLLAAAPRSLPLHTSAVKPSPCIVPAALYRCVDPDRLPPAAVGFNSVRHGGFLFVLNL
ncbi:hypothetical protein Cfor_04016 [Coptotermes formosanus]|uniref:Uncharacterized protein n=1 Tax=Coptotermes formosanus TaxID=36987 RepID=A0A6L2QAI1_COPFO|nr:hypothetical protein Cfor_04016 [Coptotermes formosanus]